MRGLTLSEWVMGVGVGRRWGEWVEGRERQLGFYIKYDCFKNKIKNFCFLKKKDMPRT